MPSRTVIRRARDADAAALAELAERTFRDAFAPSNSAGNMQRFCAVTYGESLQLAEIRDPTCETWLAEVDGAPVAFLQLRLDSGCAAAAVEHPLEIQRIYVDAQHHGTGVARELMLHAMARAAVHGADAVWLGVWERNPRAIAFYRKWGFRVVGDQVFLLGDEPQRDLVMVRPLDPAAGTQPPS